MNIKINPAMRDVLARVKTAGLHEMVRREHNLEQFTLKEAAQILGTQLIKNEAKYAAVRSGLKSLAALHSDLPAVNLDKTASLRSLLLEKTASMFDLRQLKSLIPAAEGGAKQALPELGGAAQAASHPGLFSQVDEAAQAAGKAVDPKKTIRGDAIPAQLPPMGMLPKIGALTL